MASIELELIGIKCFGLETPGLLGVDMGKKIDVRAKFLKIRKTLLKSRKTKEVNANRSMNEAFFSIKGKS